MNKARLNIATSKLVGNSGQLDWLPRNPRTWTAGDLERTKRSIERDGDFLEDRPLLVVPAESGKGERYIVFGGNLRLKACRENGVKTAPAVIYFPESDEDRETVKRRAMLDNGSFGSWDYDALANEWDDLPLVDLGIPAWEPEQDADAFGAGEEGTATEDDFDETQDEIHVLCAKGDVWQLGDHRLMCGDSTDAEMVKKLMGGNIADMAFTDPPYGVEYTGGMQFKPDGTCEHNNREMIRNDDKDLYADVFRILSLYVAGPCYVFFAGTRAANLYASAQKYGEIHALIIWVKNGGYGALNANYKQKHEPCLYWKPKNATLNFIGPTTETTVWQIDKDGVNEYHPTQKPVALAGKALSNHSGRSVLDLFGGSGSTLIAAEQLGRKCYMMELDPHYCDVIIARWEKLTGKKAIKIAG